MCKNKTALPVLVDNDEIGDVICPASCHQLVELVVASVQPLGVGDQQLELLGELLQSGRGVARRCDHHFGVFDTCPSANQKHMETLRLLVTEITFCQFSQFLHFVIVRNPV